MNWPEEVVDVLVVGGGLGGLAAAIAVRQAGRDVVVLERRDELGEVETGLTLWSFANRVLERLGVLEDVSQLGAPLERLVSLSSRGEPLSNLDLRPASRAIGAPSCDIDRAQLQALLAARVGRDRIRFGAHCVAVAEEHGHVVAGLADGSTLRGRLLVGADGVHSVARGYVAPGTPIRAGGFGVWRGVVELGERLVPSGVHVRLYGPGAVFGAARLDAKRVRWYAATRLTYTDNSARAELLARFGDWPDPARTILDASTDAPLLFNDTPRIPPLRHWVRGRVALLGDAAHAAVPTLGISGGLALADAAALGAALSDAAWENVALLAYAREREHVGRRAQGIALAFARVVAVRRPPLLSMRNRLLGRPSARLQRRGVGYLMRGAHTPRPTTDATRPAPKPTSALREQDRMALVPMVEDTPSHACFTALQNATRTKGGPMELHCLRVLLIARRLAKQQDWQGDDTVLQCAALLHDIGLYTPWWHGGPYVTDSVRAARELLAPFAWPESRLRCCLDAIERHHVPSDQRERGVEVELIRRADLIDLSHGLVRHGLPRSWLASLFTELPRRGLFLHLGRLMLSRSLERPRSLVGIFAPGKP